ncbi:hypothetical protein D3C85_1832660 [compost metagenome]
MVQMIVRMAARMIVQGMVLMIAHLAVPVEAFLIRLLLHPSRPGRVGHESGYSRIAYLDNRFSGNEY